MNTSVLKVTPTATVPSTSFCCTALFHNSARPPLVWAFAYHIENTPIGARSAKKPIARASNARRMMSDVRGTCNFERYQMRLKGKTVSSATVNTTGKKAS